jgi:hypothetical protein
MLSDRDKELRTAALWVASHHPDWSGTVLSFLEARLRSPGFPTEGAESVRDALLSFCSDAGVQKIIGDLLGDSSPKRALFLLDTVDHCELSEFPATWTSKIGDLLDHAAPEVRLRALKLVRALRAPRRRQMCEARRWRCWFAANRP